MKKATLYSTENCPNCKVALQVLSLKGYNVEYKTIGVDLTKDEFWAKNPNVRGVPFVVIEGGGSYEGLANLRKFLA